MYTENARYYEEIKLPNRHRLVGTGPLCYRWIEKPIRIPDTASSRADGRTHGIAISATGQIILFHQADPAILIFNANGSLHDAWGEHFPGAHGLTLVQEDDLEFLWLTDTKTGAVVKTTLDGRTVLTLQRPPLALYASNKYAPTAVAVHEERYGGDGNIWVADGYGMNYLHCYSKTGIYLASINGTEGTAGAFNCPHGLFVDLRKATPELYIADRDNQRVQVYDLAGNFMRAFGADFLTSPCAFAVSGTQLIIPELRARVTVLDGHDQLLGHLGAHEASCDRPGWPNHPAHQIKPGKFNSPHGIAADPQGNLYIVEWMIGGRITKLEPQK